MARLSAMLDGSLKRTTHCTSHSITPASHQCPLPCFYHCSTMLHLAACVQLCTLLSTAHDALNARGMGVGWYDDICLDNIFSGWSRTSHQYNDGVPLQGRRYDRTCSKWARRGSARITSASCWVLVLCRRLTGAGCLKHRPLCRVSAHDVYYQMIPASSMAWVPCSGHTCVVDPVSHQVLIIALADLQQAGVRFSWTPQQPGCKCMRRGDRLRVRKCFSLVRMLDVLR